MQTTKQQILILLKRAGSATIEEAAGALAVASMTARQHLVGLERDGLVRAEKVKRATGRPHYLYKLTAKGEDMFPRRYDLLAQLMLEEVACLDAGEISGLDAMAKQALLIQRVADRLCDNHRAQMEGRPLPDRVAAAADLLHSVGGFAEWCKSEGGYEIRDYNCVFATLRFEQGSDCPWHVRLLTGLLDHPVRHEVSFDGNVRCCRYIVDPGKAEEG